MKKIFASLAIVMLAAAGRADAQLSFGIKGGVSFTNISNEYNDLTRTTGHGGIFLNSKIGYGWAIQPEVLYGGMGDRYRLIPNGTATEALSYIQIPVMFQYYPVREFYLEFGPQLGLLTDAKEKAPRTTADVQYKYNTADFALNFGAGFKINPVIGFYFRYNLGLANLQKPEYTNDTYQNRGVLLGMDLTLFHSGGNGYGNRGGGHRPGHRRRY
ncbi:porin family protein [Deminuibacter soli]|uniref:PorT family protein n=1 Tax=Deminuibacter soli TaxID=2291815 RepID=A0A3E1NI19_9BACT|nr:porin family protein [Deminuibacter soli]RFM27586.1 PorT family protein [Deminuibacter soli]